MKLLHLVRVVRRSGRNPDMNRFLLLTAVSALILGSTGCLHHHTRGGLANCEPVSCEPGDGCESCGTKANSKRLLGKLHNLSCKPGERVGCVAGKLGWQRGGHNYSSHLTPGGKLRHHGHRNQSRKSHPEGAVQAEPMSHPYYTLRSPRDFLMNNPPSIGR